MSTNTAIPLDTPGDADQMDDAYLLRLYVAGQTPKSITAIKNLRRICDEHLQGRCRVEVIDLVEAPHRAKGDQILAIPTLVRQIPAPFKRIIGDLSNVERVLVGLDIVDADGKHLLG